MHEASRGGGIRLAFKLQPGVGFQERFQVRPILAIHRVEGDQVHGHDFLRMLAQERIDSTAQHGILHGFGEVIHDALVVLNAERVEKAGKNGAVLFKEPVAEEGVGGECELRPTEAGEEQGVLFRARLAFDEHGPDPARLRHGVDGGFVQPSLVCVIELKDVRRQGGRHSGKQIARRHPGTVPEKKFEVSRKSRRSKIRGIAAGAFDVDEKALSTGCQHRNLFAQREAFDGFLFENQAAAGFNRQDGDPAGRAGFESLRADARHIKSHVMIFPGHFHGDRAAVFSREFAAAGQAAIGAFESFHGQGRAFLDVDRLADLEAGDFLCEAESESHVGALCGREFGPQSKSGGWHERSEPGSGVDKFHSLLPQLIRDGAENGVRIFFLQTEQEGDGS